ncbi:MAG: hypothetical protein M3146_09100, partial [Thermoproteota archaeon]|nr:hypothetical protein [Thermoproteota archaeon]
TLMLTWRLCNQFNGNRSTKVQHIFLLMDNYQDHYHYDNDKGGKEFPTGTSSHYNYDRRPLLFMLPESPPSPELAD